MSLPAITISGEQGSADLSAVSTGEGVEITADDGEVQPTANLTPVAAAQLGRWLLKQAARGGAIRGFTIDGEVP